MKLEVGMYVRTKDGEIGKIRVIIDDMIFINTNQYYSNVLESSDDILDLLEPQDLFYVDISPDECGGIVVARIPETYCELEQLKDNIKLGKYILIGIVTKELLNENIFEVGNPNE